MVTPHAPGRRAASAAWLIAGLAASTSFAQAQERGAGAVDPGRQIPIERIREGEERPLEMLRTDYFREVVALELRALEHEAAAQTADGARIERVKTDQVTMGALLEALKHGTGALPMQRAALGPLDLYLQRFADDQKQRDILDVVQLERWERSNRTFLDGGDLAERDRALNVRRAVFESSVRWMLVVDVSNATRAGPLTPEKRQAFLADLRRLFPEAPLPAEPEAGGAAAKAIGPRPAGSAGAAAAAAASEPVPPPPGSTLPRIDGVERPLGLVPRLAPPPSD